MLWRERPQRAVDRNKVGFDLQTPDEGQRRRQRPAGTNQARATEALRERGLAVRSRSSEETRPIWPCGVVRRGDVLRIENPRSFRATGPVCGSEPRIQPPPSRKHSFPRRMDLSPCRTSFCRSSAGFRSLRKPLIPCRDVYNRSLEGLSARRNALGPG